MTEKQMSVDNLPIPSEFIERRIYQVRRQKVVLSQDLAEIYKVETRALI